MVDERPRLSSLTRTQDFKKFVLEAAERANPASTWKELDVGASRVTGYASSNPALLVQTYWETGEIFQTPYLVLPDYKFNVTLPKTPDAVPKGVCHSEQICYCGAAVCVYAGDFWVDPGVPQKYWTPLEIPAADVWSEKRRLEIEELRKDQEQRLKSEHQRSQEANRKLESQVDQLRKELADMQKESQENRLGQATAGGAKAKDFLDLQASYKRLEEETERLRHNAT